MTRAEFDLASLDVFEYAQSFLEYCPTGSFGACKDSVLPAVIAKYDPAPDEQRKLFQELSRVYASLTGQPQPKFKQQKKYVRK